MTQKLKIYNPIWCKEDSAYFAITDWNFRKLGDMLGSIIVEVYDGGVFKGWNTVYSKQWKKNCKLKKRVVKLRPNEPLNFYYGIMSFEKMSLDEYQSREFIKTIY